MSESGSSQQKWRAGNAALQFIRTVSGTLSSRGPSEDKARSFSGAFSRERLSQDRGSRGWGRVSNTGTSRNRDSIALEEAQDAARRNAQSNSSSGQIELVSVQREARHSQVSTASPLLMSGGLDGENSSSLKAFGAAVSADGEVTNPLAGNPQCEAMSPEARAALAIQRRVRGWSVRTKLRHWEWVTEPDGTKYAYNTKTGQSRWDMPTSIAEQESAEAEVR